MIRVLCPRGHFIASVDITDDGQTIIPRGTRHGLVWDHAPSLDVMRVRATCPRPRCPYDGSTDYRVLCAEIAAAAARGDAEHRLTI